MCILPRETERGTKKKKREKNIPHLVIQEVLSLSLFSLVSLCVENQPSWPPGAWCSPPLLSPLFISEKEEKNALYTTFRRRERKKVWRISCVQLAVYYTNQQEQGQKQQPPSLSFQPRKKKEEKFFFSPLNLLLIPSPVQNRYMGHFYVFIILKVETGQK